MDDRELLNLKKTSESIVVMGSGWSINNISEYQWKAISNVNSIGFNWFCKHQFAPTFYIIREQANIASRKNHDESPEALISLLSKKNYKDTLMIVLDVSKHSPHAFKYRKLIKTITNQYITIKDFKVKGSFNIKYMFKDMFNVGLYHGKCSLVNVIHFILQMKYENVYFAGVDLYDSRYFWLREKETRHTVKNKCKKYNSKHAVAGYTLKFLNKIQKNTKLKMYSLSEKSLLCKIMEYKTFP